MTSLPKDYNVIKLNYIIRYNKCHLGNSCSWTKSYIERGYYGRERKYYYYYL